MNTESSRVSFQLLQKTYEVTCPPGQHQPFSEAVDHLHKQMKKVQASDPHASAEQIAVVTALNLSHEYIKLSQSPAVDPAPRLEALSQRAAEVLKQAKKANVS